MQSQHNYAWLIKSVTLCVHIFPEWRHKRIIWRVVGCEQDGSLSYRMRNVFIQADSYHNLQVMNERPLCGDAERNEIKRRVINRPAALNNLRVHAGKNRNESISRTLYLSNLSQYTKLRLSLSFPFLSPLLVSPSFPFSLSLFKITCRGRDISEL